jgi:hypothetical protein
MFKYFSPLFCSKVDGAIVGILRKRKEECLFWHGKEEGRIKCQKAIDDYETSATNYFIKCENLIIINFFYS